METYGDVVPEHPGYDASAYDDTLGDTYDALPDTEALAADAYVDSPAGTIKQLPSVNETPSYLAYDTLLRCAVTQPANTCVRQS